VQRFKQLTNYNGAKCALPVAVRIVANRLLVAAASQSMLETQCCSSIVASAVCALVDRHAHWSKVEIKTVRRTNNSTGGLPAALTTPAVAKHKTQTLAGTDQSQGYFN
jgi:hypothetical protein